MIKLFDSSERSFNSNGLGVLSDVLTCTVKEKLNGEYELEMTYPVNGKHFSDIEYDRILFVKPNVHDDPQPFRIYEISTVIDGKITISAEHISYDASGIPIWPVAPYYVDTPSQLIQYIRNHSIVENPFSSCMKEKSFVESNPMLNDRLRTISAEYSVSEEILVEAAVKRLIDDIDFVRGLRMGKTEGYTRYLN